MSMLMRPRELVSIHGVPRNVFVALLLSVGVVMGAAPSGNLPELDAVVSKLAEGNVRGAVAALNGGFRFDTAKGLAALRVFSLRVLQEGLKEADPYERCFAANALAGHGDWSGAGILEDAIASPDPGVRRAAIEGLGEIGSSEALRRLKAIYRTSDSYGQLLVLQGLQGANAPEALELLIEALREADLNLRVQALEDLGLLGDRRAIRALQGVLRRESAPAFEKTTAALALLRLGDRAGVSLLLATVGGDGTSADRAAATLALGYGHDEKLVPRLTDLLSDQDPDVTIAAAVALTRHRRKDGLPRLRQALHDKDATTRRRTGVLLEHVNYTVGREVVLAGLTAEDVDVRLLAAHAVGLAGNAQDTGALVAMLSADNDPIMRAAVAWALGRVAKPSVIAPLLDLVQEQAPAVRYTAADGLARTASRLPVARREGRRHSESAPVPDRERPKAPKKVGL